MLIQSRYADMPQRLLEDLFPGLRGHRRETARIEAMIREVSLGMGCEIALTREDDGARHDLDWCEGCAQRFHNADLVPCDVLERMCRSCLQTFDTTHHLHETREVPHAQ